MCEHNLSFLLGKYLEVSRMAGSYEKCMFVGLLFEFVFSFLKIEIEFTKHDINCFEHIIQQHLVIHNVVQSSPLSTSKTFSPLHK